MQQIWISHLKTSKERDDFKKTLKNSRKALDKLLEIVYTIISSKSNTKVSDYTNSSWAYKQAHINGYLEACRDLVALLDIEGKHRS